jgi:hypothetical protein
VRGLVRKHRKHFAVELHAQAAEKRRAVRVGHRTRRIDVDRLTQRHAEQLVHALENAVGVSRERKRRIRLVRGIRDVIVACLGQRRWARRKFVAACVAPFSRVRRLIERPDHQEQRGSQRCYRRHGNESADDRAAEVQRRAPLARSHEAVPRDQPSDDGHGELRADRFAIDDDGGRRPLPIEQSQRVQQRRARHAVDEQNHRRHREPRGGPRKAAQPPEGGAEHQSVQ